MREGSEDRSEQNHKINYLKKRFTTGWLLNEMGGAGVADWTNVHLGTDPTDPTDNLTHNMGRNLRELDVKVFISTDGTDANSFEIGDMQVLQGVGYFGITISQVDINNIKIQTGAQGIIYFNDAGTEIRIDTENWYYNIVVKT